MQTSPSTSVISVSKTGTPTLPTLRTPERHDGFDVAPIVTSVRPYPSPMTASGNRFFSSSMTSTGSGAAPDEIPRTLDRSTSSINGWRSSATKIGGAPPIPVPRERGGALREGPGADRWGVVISVPGGSGKFREPTRPPPVEHGGRVSNPPPP